MDLAGSGMTGQQPLWGAPDTGTIATVECVDSDHRRGHDRAAIDRAIERIAAQNNGRVDPNLVRAELSNEHGLTVNPRSLSARYMALTAAHVLTWDPSWPDGWTENLDVEGGNKGKPIKVRRYVGKTA